MYRDPRPNYSELCITDENGHERIFLTVLKMIIYILLAILGVFNKDLTKSQVLIEKNLTM